MFPYEQSVKHLISLLENHLPSALKEHTEKIVNLHLRLDTLAMPNMTRADCQTAINHIINGQSLNAILKTIILEETHLKTGMFRVLLRTHLNRSGINDVSMSNNHQHKTLSPRILNFIESIDVNADFFKVQHEIIPAWLAFARKNENESTAESIRYNDDAIYSLEKMTAANNFIIESLGADLKATKKLSGISLKRQLNDERISASWCKIVLGTITGLRYLHSRNWDLYNQTTNTTLTYKEIHGFTKECQNRVNEYGYALAGSYLADLGGSCFVKDDTHVKDCMMALSSELNSPEKRVKAVIESAQQLNVAPRFIDKIMYMAGSGNLYLLGLTVENSTLLKREFICWLKNMQSK